MREVFRPGSYRRPALVVVGLLLAALTAVCGDKAERRQPRPAGKSAPVARTTVRITGIPDQDPAALQRSYAPLVAMLEQALDADVVYVPVTNYDAAVQALAAGTVDFAWLGGLTHVQARNRTEVVPLAMRDIDRSFHSVFIARADSGVETMDDLAGKRFAFGAKHSTSGHLMPRHFLLEEHDIDPDTDFDGPPVFSGAHDKTAEMVASGQVDAGALNMQIWERMVQVGELDPDEVRVLWTTPPYVDYVWTARAAVDADLRAAFRDALLALTAEDSTHRPILERLGAAKYVPAQADDFDAIEAVARQAGLLR